MYIDIVPEKRGHTHAKRIFFLAGGLKSHLIYFVPLIAMTAVSDSTLIETLKKNSELAFRQLFDRHWSSLFALCYHHLNNREVCAEIVHDIFLQLWERRHTQEISSLPAYLSTAARYQVYKRFRQSAPALIDVDMAEGLAENNMGESNLRFKELRKEIELHLEELPAQCSRIFRMSRFEHYSIEEIATQLGISKRTVENQLTRALGHLRNKMSYAAVIIPLAYLFR